MLRALSTLGGPSASASHRLRSLEVVEPVLMVVLEGEKRLSLGARRLVVRRGEAVLVHRPCSLDVENLVSRSGRYRAWVTSFPWQLVEAARALLPALQVSTEVLTLHEATALSAALRGFLDAATPAQTDAVRLRLLVTLAEQGATAFLSGPAPTFERRLRTLLASAPSKAWSASHVERLLGVSGATLRRKLASAGTSWRDVLVDVRLHHGLQLLQTTELPLKRIAFECGYRSTRAFNERFTARFGATPGQLVNAPTSAAHEPQPPSRAPSRRAPRGRRSR
ncbi:MAG: helix-turn-helix transcriptional regulator [Myxococcaceae bacterium]